MRPNSDICNTDLLQESDTGHKPIKTYVYHHFFNYLGRLLSRKDLEEQMDKVCNDFKQSLSQPLPRYVTNTFEADFTQSFKGPEPGMLFIERGNEGHFLFVVHVDFLQMRECLFVVLQCHMVSSCVHASIGNMVQAREHVHCWHIWT
jgi:hypothetical protein